MAKINVNISGHLCKFDEEDYNKYKCYGMSVCVKPDGVKNLVFSAGPFKTKRVCRIILDAPTTLEVDHKDGDTLNSCKDNIRLATSQQNKFNTKGKSKSGLPKGVVKHGRKFRAALWRNYQRYYLGIFNTPEEAGRAYEEAAKKRFGEFAFVNR